MVSYRSISAFEGYFRWNDALFASHYSGDFEGHNSYLDLSETELDQILSAGAGDSSSDSSLSVDPLKDFIKEVAHTLYIPSTKHQWRTRYGRQFFRRHKSWAREWKDKGSEGIPPFIGLLGLFCLTANRMGTQQDGYHFLEFYGRLSAILNLPEIMGCSGGDAKEYIHREFTRDSWQVGLWEMLEHYLDYDLNGTFGWSSAEPMGGNRHIGYAVSQTVFSRGDRDKLGVLFNLKGFNPGSVLEVDQIEEAIGTWISSPPLSARAKNFWDKGGQARKQVCEIALRELASWDGRFVDESGNVSSRLIAHGYFRMFPSRKLSIRLGIKDVTSIKAGNYKAIISGDSSASKDLVVDESGSVSVEDQLSGTPLNTILRGRVSFRHIEDPMVRLSWGSKRILVLNFDHDMNHFISGSRLKLGTKSIVLERSGNSIGSQLAALGSEHQVLPRTTIDSLPDDWQILYPVQIDDFSKTSFDRHSRVSSILPLEKSDLVFSGGFSIPSGSGRKGWLVEKPPFVEILSSIQPSKMLITGQSVDLTRTVTISPQHGPIDLSNQNLPEGVYRLDIEALGSDNEPITLVGKTVTLHSPDPIRKIEVNNAHRSSSAVLWPLSTSNPVEIESEDVGIEISGAVIEGDIPSNRDIGELPPERLVIDNFAHDEIIAAEEWYSGSPKVLDFQDKVVECVHKYEVEEVRFDVEEEQFIDDEGVLHNFPYQLAVRHPTRAQVAMSTFLETKTVKKLGISYSTRDKTFYNDLAKRIKLPINFNYLSAVRTILIEQLTKSELTNLPSLLSAMDNEIPLTLSKYVANQTEWEIEIYRRKREEMAIDSLTKEIIAPIKHYKRRCNLCGKIDFKDVGDSIPV